MKKNTVLLITAAQLFATGAALADPQYGALAVDRNNGFVYGFSFDQPSRAEAQKRAVAEATKRGGKASVVVEWSGNGCAAYRTIDPKAGSAYGWGIAPTRAAADQIARAELKKRAPDVNTSFVWACNSNKDKLEILKNEPVSEGGIAEVQRFGLPYYTSDLVFTKDGKRLVTTVRQEVTMWNAKTGKREFEFAGLTSASFNIGLSPNGRYLVAADQKHLFVWDAANGKTVGSYDHDKILNQFGFSPDSSTLYAIGSPDWQVKGEFSEWLWRFKLPDASLIDKVKLAQRDAANTRNVEYAPSINALYVAREDKNYGVPVYDMTTGKETRIALREEQRAIALSPDGTRLAAGNPNGSFVADAATGNILFKMGTVLTHVVRYSADGKYIAAGQHNGKVTIWNAQTGELINELNADPKYVSEVAFSPDGRWLATSGGDTSVRIWDFNAVLARK